MALDSNSILASRPVKEVYAVSRLVREARGVLEGSFPLIWVEGEISNLAMPGSGHIYFTLKDDAAQVRCAMFRNRNKNVRFTPKNGIQVLLRVRVTLYEGRGEFQLVVEHMEEAGSGALQRAYEALKFRLGEEGLFDQTNKQLLPILPQSIGVISSPDGAAVHDILTVLKRRFSAANVILYPVAVQGADSAKQIAKMITLADSRQECDVLIVGRGGGSLEDLWSFNDELVARALFSCQTPVISAVGHEVDFTIADFVADIRAPTPSAAAELAVPDSTQWLIKIHSHQHRLTLLIKHRLHDEKRQLHNLRQRLPQPLTVINQHMQCVDQLGRQLHRSWLQIINTRRQQVDYWSLRLKSPQAKIEANQDKLRHLIQRLQQNLEHNFSQKSLQNKALFQRLALNSPMPKIKQQLINVVQISHQLETMIKIIIDQKHVDLAQKIRTLSAVSPLNTLERGYSITTDVKTQVVIRHANEVKAGQEIKIQLQDGTIQCQVKDH